MGLQPKFEEEDRESILPVLRPEGDLSSGEAKPPPEEILAQRAIISSKREVCQPQQMGCCVP
jgi:hypothetical protein